MDCVLHSFAHVSGYNPDYIVKWLGHNGREIINSDLKEPYCFRGFNVHEISRFMYEHNWAVINILKHDICLNSKMRGPVWLNTDRDYIKPYLSENFYCLANSGHMIGVSYNIVLDLENKIRSPEQFNYEQMFLLKKIET